MGRQEHICRRGKEREDGQEGGREGGTDGQTDTHCTCMLMSFAGTSSACDTSTDKLIRFMAVCEEKIVNHVYISFSS